ncbi:AI-2E family transporter [Candidatus Woesearchaeota archaeon]|nr:MAG: AI-2E family transporter [Candidatus Woesearchaeota archaeon]
MSSEQRLVNIAIIFIAVVVFIVVLKELQAFLRPFAIALILTFLLMPVLRFSRRTKLPMSVIVVGVVIVLFFLTFLLVWVVSNQTANLNERLALLVGSFETMLETTAVGGVPLSEFIDPNAIGRAIATAVRQGAAGIGNFISELFLAILFTLFILPSHERLVHAIGAGLDERKRKRFQSALRETEEAIRGYLYAKTLISLGTAVATALLLWAFQSDLVIVLALITFILNYIPNIGSVFAVIVAAGVYALLHGLGWPLLFLTLLLILVQAFFGNYLEPKFAGRKLSLSPTIILLSLFLWYWIWGVVGMLLAVPLTSILRIVLSHIDATKPAAKWLS